MGGAGKVCPPDSDWGDALRGPSVCPWGVPGTAVPKNKHLKVGVPEPPSRMKAKKWVGYSLAEGRLFLGEVLPPNSEWGKALRGPSVCP